MGLGRATESPAYFFALYSFFKATSNLLHIKAIHNGIMLLNSLVVTKSNYSRGNAIINTPSYN